MTTSELLRQEANIIEDQTGRLLSSVVFNLRQEADRLEGVFRPNRKASLEELGGAIKEFNRTNKPKPEKLEAFSGGIVPVEKLDGSFNEWVCTTLHTLTRRENERNGYE